MRCEACRAFYEEVLELERQMSFSDAEEVMPMILKNLYSETNDLIAVCKIMRQIKEDVSLSILSNNKMRILRKSVEPEVSAADISEAVARKLYKDEQVEAQASNEVVCIKDAQSLYLRLDRDMTFNLFYPKQKSNEEDYVILADIQRQRIFVSQLKEYNTEQNIVQFSDVEDGMYQLFSTTNLS